MPKDKIIIRATISVPENDMVAKAFLKGVLNKLNVLHLTTKPKAARQEFMAGKLKVVPQQQGRTVFGVTICSKCNCWPCRCEQIKRKSIVKYIGRNQEGTNIKWEVSEVKEMSMPLPPEKEHSPDPPAAA